MYSVYRNSAVFLTALILLSGCASTTSRTLKPYRLAVKANPSDPVTHYDLGSAALAVGKYRTARKALNNCLELEPDNINALIKLAQSEDGLDKLIEANNLYRQVLTLDPTHLEARIQLGTRELNMIMNFELFGQIALFGHIMNLTDFQFALLESWDLDVEEMKKIYIETLEIWKELVREKPDNAEFWGNLGTICNLTNNFEGAIYSFQEAQSLDKEFFTNRELHQQIFTASLAGQKWIPERIY